MPERKYPAIGMLLEAAQTKLDIEADGFIGRNTEAALVKFYKDHGSKLDTILEDLAEAEHLQAEIETPTILQPPKKEIVIPGWLLIAESHIGEREVHGSKHNPLILMMWRVLGLPFKNDETPWCAGAMGYCLERAGYRSTRSGMARSYEKYGEECDPDKEGAILVFYRGRKNSPFGHVAMRARAKPRAPSVIPALGGNQGDEFCIKQYCRRKLITARWPRPEDRLPAKIKVEVEY